MNWTELREAVADELSCALCYEPDTSIEKNPQISPTEFEQITDAAMSDPRIRHAVQQKREAELAYEKNPCTETASSRDETSNERNYECNAALIGWAMIVTRRTITPA